VPRPTDLRGFLVMCELRDNFIQKAKNEFGDKYDYKLVYYKSRHDEISIICPLHGVFNIKPKHFLSRTTGCKSCRNTDKRKKKLATMFSGKYSYSLVNDIPSERTIIDVVCKKHGVFSEAYQYHVSLSKGCYKCQKEKYYEKEHVSYINKAKAMFGDKFDYSNTKYLGSNKEIVFICKKHGKVSQQANAHISSKHGCKKCSDIASGRKRRYNQDDFIKKAKKIHLNKYDYSKAVYDTSGKHITIICKKHGEFEQSAHNHLKGYGCYKCGGSKGIDGLVDKPTILYLCEVVGVGTMCYKFGITVNTPEYRYKSAVEEYNVLSQCKMSSRKEAFELELRFKRFVYKNVLYPEKSFRDGVREFSTEEIDIYKINTFVNKRISFLRYVFRKNIRMLHVINMFYDCQEGEKS